MTNQQKRLLANYAEIKQISTGNLLINIPDSDYPKYKDTLDYLVEYHFIQPFDIDSGDSQVFLKTDAFDTFTEYMLSQEMEDTEVQTAYDNKKVFIVHGHDHQLLDEVKLLLFQIGLKPIVLMDEVNAGRTIIEKLEDATDVGFAIVLYTACDEGRKKGSPSLRDRARQNVIFEHGYLCAKLGRNRVVALNNDDIEVPSDLAGVLYIPHSSPDWKMNLMREMQNAKLNFSLTQTQIIH